MKQSYYERYPGILDSSDEKNLKKHIGIYDLKYLKTRFSDQEINKFMEELKQLQSMAGQRIIIHGISVDGLKFTHHGKLLPYKNTAQISTSIPDDYGCVSSDIKFLHYTKNTEEFEFNHLVEVSNSVNDEMGIFDGHAHTFISKFLFSPFFHDMDPSCLYILDIYSESTGQILVENINKPSLLKSTEQVESSKKQYGLDIEGCKLDPVSQKIYQNISNFIILNGQLYPASSLKIGEYGIPYAVLGYNNESIVPITENSELIVLTPQKSNEHDSFDSVWSKSIVNNPEEYLKVLKARTEYIQNCLSSGQPTKN